MNPGLPSETAVYPGVGDEQRPCGGWGCPGNGVRGARSIPGAPPWYGSGLPSRGSKTPNLGKTRETEKKC